jgi:hypothetical protein
MFTNAAAGRSSSVAFVLPFFGLKIPNRMKNDVISLSYFMDVGDVEITREINLVHSTIYTHQIS